MRRSLRTLLVTAAGVLFLAVCASAVSPEMSKADPALMHAMQSGRSTFGVIVGLRDGTVSPRALLAHPDPAGEEARRARRIAAQQKLVSSLAREQFSASDEYESFSMVAGVASVDGVRALAERSDVDWIVLDGTRYLSASLAPQQLIHSDSANALGFRGAGATVAILDTGVDTNVVGGGAFPNAKVVGGFNPTEPGSPPFDCEGHGTSVASIVAGSTGVAPDAKIVAVKVFPACEGFTYDSVILSGLDFVISNRAKFNITAANMSLGASPTGDNSSVGFCDTFSPQFAGPIDSATAAGIVVTVAAGNSGTSNQISSPGCVTSAVSVGAVYPLAASGFDWGLCSDTAIVPGSPTCFSNSNTNLTLLAPGAFWSVPTAGGEIISFSGTSAAAPAVAGVVALVRAARPTLSASTTVSLLRATGRPILDKRNNVVTPLVDALAAVQFAPGTFGNLDALPIAIPDGTGSATATVTVSGFSGFLSTVQAFVEIDHSAPQQLRLTLTGPDGTSVILHDQSGAAEQPINTIFGSTGAPLFSLNAFYGKQANGTWTLKVEDLVPGVSGRILHFSVTPIAGLQLQPREAIPLNINGQILPIVARTQGTHFFQTDVRLFNPNPVAKEFDLFFVGTGNHDGSFVGTGQTGANAFKSARIVGPGQILNLTDVVMSEFGLTDSFGQITVDSEDLSSFIVASRTYTNGPTGTYGFAAPGFPTSTALMAGVGTATANGLGKGPGSHTNVGFTESSGFPVTVRIDIRDGNGTLLGTTSRTTPGYTTLNITDILLDRGIPSQTNIRADFTVVSPQGRAIPWATTVDDVTGDSAFHAGILPALTGDDIIVTQTAHILGTNGNLFRTMLNITNTDVNPATVVVSLLPITLGSQSLPLPITYGLAPGQTLEFPDVLATEFNLEFPAVTALRVHPLAPASLVVSARTTVTKLNSVFGFTVDGIRASRAIGVGSPTLTTIFLDQSNAAGGSHTNFGFTEVGGAFATVQVTAVSGDNGTVLGGASYLVNPNSTFQTTLGNLLGSSGVTASNFYLQFSVIGGSGAVIPYASTVDNTSGDVTYIPAQ